ncbi:NPCBM/NEW2 domain-containing protein [Streptomyces sp. 11x1]|uniref:NPCBM/NEW2 domain-containing protein n=1 Tax=Streptomyces sp. 11x1 TaxID=3038642 RepID=UPI00292D821E|nr:NPCBM/NEW2 domain-containing protein [Streptomyces sp. 11x1]WNZ06185.1 NPCBM/NEW2 domain-containing protein [Streptomyces sp. 11x1]
MNVPRKASRTPLKRFHIAAAGMATAVMLAGTGACGGEGRQATQPTRTITQTVTAGETSTPSPSVSTSPTSQTRYLSDLTPLTSSQGVDTSAVEINGEGFARSVTLIANAAGPVNSVEYNLSRHWDMFSATIGLRDDSPTGGKLTFEVSVDGKQEYSETVPLGRSQKIELDLSNALRMKLTVTYSGQDAGSSYYGSWGNARLSS